MLQARHSGLLRSIFKQIAWLAVQGLTDRFQRLKTYGPGLAGLQNGQIGQGDPHPFTQLIE